MNGPEDPRQGYVANPAGQYTGQRAPDMPAGPPVWRQDVREIGVPTSLTGDPRRKSPALAAILSLMPGLGQVYVGYYQQGFTNIIIIAAVIALMVNARFGSIVHHLLPFLGLFLAFFWLYNVVDAFRRAAFYNQALSGVGAVEIPEDMKLPKGRGSLVGGIALIALGLLLFANTALGMSLDWLEQWWPMGLVLLGAYLVYASVAGKRAAEAQKPAPEPVDRS